MSELYTSSSDARQQTAGIGKTGNFWQDWYTDRVRDGIKLNPETGEYDKTGLAFWGGLIGLNNDSAVSAIEKGKEKIRESEKIEATLAKFPGVTDEQLLEASGGKGLTGSNVKGVVSEAVRTRAEEPTPMQEAQIADSKATQSRLLEAQRNSNTIAEKNLIATINQGNQSHKLALLQMADNADARAADLAYQKSRDRKADLQYNERMEQLDRKDRQTAYANIGAGLAALAAAFAA